MFKNLMRKNRLVKMTVAIVALAALVTGGYIYKDAIPSRIARTVAVVRAFLADGTQVDESVIEK